MVIATSYRAPANAALLVARDQTGDSISFAAEHYPQWVDEVTVATGRGTCFAARDAVDGAVLSFGCHSVWRHGWMGPFATHPERKGSGAGSAVLGAMCADLEAGGAAAANICWVGPTAFYAKAGATVSRVYRTLRLGV
jgi:hypothetical protein